MGERARRGGPALVAAAVAAALLTLPASGASSAPTTRVSVATGGGQANGNSIAPAISKDGRYVAFYSDASNLVAGDTNRARDVFLHDRQTGETTRVSVAQDGAQANGESFAPAISGDGNVVAYESDATNLVTADANGQPDVFVYDRSSGATTRASASTGGTEGDAPSGQATLERTEASSPSRPSPTT